MLESAWAAVAPEQVGTATVLPLLNGVDHVARLRERYPNVMAGVIVLSRSGLRLV